jgi:hypothetical protein
MIERLGVVQTSDRFGEEVRDGLNSYGKCRHRLMAECAGDQQTVDRKISEPVDGGSHESPWAAPAAMSEAAPCEQDTYSLFVGASADHVIDDDAWPAHHTADESFRVKQAGRFGKTRRSCC